MDNVCASVSKNVELYTENKRTHKQNPSRTVHFGFYINVLQYIYK